MVHAVRLTLRAGIPIEALRPAQGSQALSIYQTRAAAKNAVIPPPLDHSAKCTSCSLAGICLPDETLTLQAIAAMNAPAAAAITQLVQVGVPLKPRHHEVDEEPTMIRRLYPPKADDRVAVSHMRRAAKCQMQIRTFIKQSKLPGLLRHLKSEDR